MSFISKNIRYLRVANKLSQEQLAEQLNITRSRIGSYEEGRSEPNIETLILLSGYFKLPVDALVKTNLSRAEGKPFIDIGNNRVLFPITVNANNDNVIEVIPIKASAGYLDGYTDPEYIEQLQHVSLPFLAHEKCRAFPIKGDSMPPLKEGALVVAKFVEDYAAIKSGKTYVVLTRNNGLVYKRINNLLQTEQVFELVSDNVLYAPYKVKADEVLEIWEYVCVIATDVAPPQEPMANEAIVHILHKMQTDIEALKR
jgi:transcriptional regulator with XRE-family HTH domain